MKLACLGDTSAVPSRRPFAPETSTSRPAESSGGFTNTEPALAPPGWFSRRHAHDLGDRGLGLGAVARRQVQLGLDHELVRRDARTAKIQDEVGRAHLRILAAAQVESADPHQARGHVRAVPTGVHPHRPTDRTGHADGPLEPGEAGRGSTAGHDRKTAQRHRRAPRVPVDVDVGEPLAERDRETAESRVGDQQVRTLADQQDVDAGRAERRPRRRRDRSSVSARTNRAAAPPTR